MNFILKGENKNTAKNYNKIFIYQFLMKGFDMSQPLRAKSLLKEFRGGNFLEVGCGIAPHCLLAYGFSKVSEVWALDIADELIAELKRRYPQINYVVGNANYLPFRDEYFDYLIVGELLEHMEKPEETLKEFFRVLKKGGILALSVPLNDSGGIAPEQHLWSFDESDIKSLLGKFGEVETSILEEDNHNYIIGYGRK